MKTWEEVKEGDIIYYYDHCKIKPQIVHKVEVKEYDHSYKDWWNPSRTITERIKEINIEAGKSSEIYIDAFYFNKTYTRYNGLTRFSCKEAALDFLKELIDTRIKNAAYYDEKLKKELSILSKYQELNKNL